MTCYGKALPLPYVLNRLVMSSSCRASTSFQGQRGLGVLQLSHLSKMVWWSWDASSVNTIKMCQHLCVGYMLTEGPSTCGSSRRTVCSGRNQLLLAVTTAFQNSGGWNV
jgi:hypothetical protein